MRVPISSDSQNAPAATNVTLKLEAFMPYRLNVLATTVSEGLAQVYSARFGLDIPGWRVIATLGQLGATTAKAIGHHTHMHKTKVSRTIGGLEKRQLVKRSPNSSDKREAFVSLLGAGRTVYEEIIPLAQAYQTQLLAVLSQQEQEVLEKVLNTLHLQAERLLFASNAD